MMPTHPHFLILLCFLFVSFSRAQDNPPACAIPCAQSAASRIGCDISDISCFCFNADFLKDAGQCVGQNCAPADVEAASEAIGALCIGLQPGSVPPVDSASASPTSTLAFGPGPVSLSSVITFTSPSASSTDSSSSSPSSSSGSSTTSPTSSSSSTTVAPSSGSTPTQSSSTGTPTTASSTQTISASNNAAAAPTRAAAFLLGGVGAIVVLVA
ncbi:hypothetical protein BC834DRAFT_276241 [Gloeopeniophorella convolvens]|nr:hypothetical protein BC834DRAFT_276241 [Gloeopeniophorella convolvens]